MYKLKSVPLMKTMSVLLIVLAGLYIAFFVRKVLLLVGILPVVTVFDAADGIGYCTQVCACAAILLVIAINALAGNVDGVEFLVVLMFVLEAIWVFFTLFTNPINFVNLSLNAIGVVLLGVWWYASRPDIVLHRGAAPMSEFMRMGPKRD